MSANILARFIWLVTRMHFVFMEPRKGFEPLVFIFQFTKLVQSTTMRPRHECMNTDIGSLFCLITPVFKVLQREINDEYYPVAQDGYGS